MRFFYIIFVDLTKYHYVNSRRIHCVSGCQWHYYRCTLCSQRNLGEVFHQT